jgi:FKBP-type peptidyl-prolyl cis-trans isomerase FklB
LGVTFVRSFKSQNIKLDLDAMSRGMKDAASGKAPPFAGDAPLISATTTRPVGATQPVGAEATTTPATGPVTAIAGYDSGFMVVRGLSEHGLDVDWNIVVQGMHDEESGAHLQLTEAQVKGYLRDFNSEASMKVRGERLLKNIDNQKISNEFMVQNKTKEGIVALPSGLQYKVITAGTGQVPTRQDTVEINCRGAITDGTVFEDTYKAGKARTFEVNDGSVIAGLREAVQHMPAGSKWQLFIPPRLGYLYRGFGKIVEPGVVLVYEVELLNVKPGPAATQPTTQGVTP